MIGAAVLILAVMCVAFTNGANANFKGVASLYGSGTTSLKTAMWIGNVATMAGSVASFWIASKMLQSFGGKGIIPNDIVQSLEFAAAVAFGAAGTSFLATRFAFPVSTTHALIGAIAGSGLAASWLGATTHSPQWSVVVSSILLPLIASPFLSIVLALLLYAVLRGLGWAREERNSLVDRLHIFSGAAASFARGMNDTPKMVAILLLLPNANVGLAFGLVAIAIALGGWFDSSRVAETLGKKITDLNSQEGMLASMVTSVLVATASFHSLPVSTTHVSVGALTGIGLANRRAHWKMIGEILLAWVTTVPCGLLVGAICYMLLRLMLLRV
jgi:inorganic phosphate transporter, PiT family